MKKLLSLLMILCLVFVFTACGNGGDENNTTEHPEVFVAAISGEVLSLDPQIAAGTPAEVARMEMFESLITQNDDGTFSPCLAESWEVSEDGTTYTFHLRKDVKFHDGSDMTADDVVATFQRLMTEHTVLHV